MLKALEAAIVSASNAVAVAGEDTGREFAGTPAPGQGAGATMPGLLGPPVAAGGGMGGPGIGAGGKVPRPQGPLGVSKTDSLIPGTPGKGPELVRPVRGAPDRADPRASYYEVYPSARRAAEDALSREQVPSGYRKPVKEYFDSIAPK